MKPSDVNGYPMTFIRLTGCSVKECHIRTECDEAPWKMRERLSVEQTIAQQSKHVRSCRWSAYCIVCPSVRRGEHVASREVHILRLRKTRQLCARHTRTALALLQPDICGAPVDS